VVGAGFCTADPFVFAAGTFAKFSRKYGNTLNMERYDSQEVGQRLASAVLQHIDPVSMGKVTSPATLPPLGIRPFTTEGLLPGGLHYLLSMKPALQDTKHPQVLVTHSNNRVCRLDFDELSVLRSISYIGDEPVQARNLRCLVGLPSSYLNRILYRYSQDEIPDLIEFLQAPWSTALYHESFPALRSDLRHVMSSSQNEITALTKQVMSMLQARSTGEEVDALKLSTLVETMPASVKEMVQLRLLQFMELHSNHLPHLQVPMTN